VFDALPDELSTSCVRFSFVLLWLADGSTTRFEKEFAPFLNDEEPDDLGVVLTATLTLPSLVEANANRHGIRGIRDGARFLEDDVRPEPPG